MRQYFSLIAAIVITSAATADEGAIKEAYRAFVAADEKGDKKKALAAAEQAFTLAQAEWGGSNKQTGVLAANYANQLAIAGRDDDAARTFDLCAELLAAHESAVADRLSCILGAGDANLRQEDYETAHDRFRAVIAAGEALTTDSPKIASTVGEAYLGLTIFGESFPLVLSPRGTIGSGQTSSRILRRPPDKDVSLAEVKFNAQRALEMFERAKATDTTSYAAALRVLGSAAKFDGDLASAVSYYRRSADILAAKLGETDRQTVLMRGRQKFTEFELRTSTEMIEPPFTRVPSRPDCKLKRSGGVEMETCVKLRIPPYFPNSEIYKDQQGFVLLRFDINTKGKTENVEVIIDWPGGVFTERAVKAASKWTYTPPTDPTGAIGRIEDVETIIQYIIR